MTRMTRMTLQERVARDATRARWGKRPRKVPRTNNRHSTELERLLRDSNRSMSPQYVNENKIVSEQLVSELYHHMHAQNAH